MATLLFLQMVIFPVPEMATFPVPEMAILPVPELTILLEMATLPVPEMPILCDTSGFGYGYTSVSRKLRHICYDMRKRQHSTLKGSDVLRGKCFCGIWKCRNFAKREDIIIYIF